MSCHSLIIVCVITLPLTFSGLAKVAVFTTNVDAENQTLINHKCVCGALNRHFCQTRVRRMCFYSHLSVSKSLGDTFSVFAIIKSVSIDGCISLVHHLETVDLSLPICSASQILVFSCSASTDFILLYFFVIA